MDEHIQPIRKPKIISFDLEVSPALGYFYPPTWETGIIKMSDRQRLMSFAWNVVGETTKKRINGEIVKVPKVHARCLYDTDTYKVDPQNDELLIRELHEVMSDADILLGQNSDQFDIKMANYFFIKVGLPPIPPTRSIDTKKVAKRYFRFPNNKLDTLGEELGVGGKTKVTQGDIWYDCFVLGDKKSWKLMNEYCANDVMITTLIYLKMKKFMRSHPNLARISGDFDACPGCNGFDYRVRAYRYSNTSRYIQYSCNDADCGIYFSTRGSITEKQGDQKPLYNVA